MKENKKKIFLVSGVTSGMGLAFCNLLQAEGHDVIPIVRDKTKLVNSEKYQNIIECDYSDPEQIDHIFQNFNVEIDAFVNFAAVLPGRSIMEQVYEGLQDLFNINVISPILIMKNIKNRIKKGGSIVLIGSISGQKGSFDDPYAASKGAIHSLVKSLALKFAPDIRVVGIAPGITDNTGMTNNLIPGLYEQNIEKVPLKCAGRPEDIAKIALMLTSESAQFITGSMIDINGGQYLR